MERYIGRAASIGFAYSLGSRAGVRDTLAHPDEAKRGSAEVHAIVTNPEGDLAQVHRSVTRGRDRQPLPVTWREAR